MTMSTPPIRLLQIADLFITAKDNRAKADYERLRQRLELVTNGNGAKGFDYLVVCGNLTRTGTEPEFTTALGILETLARGILLSSLKDSWKARTIVVPGPFDLSINSDNFNEFYREHFATYDYETLSFADTDPWHNKTNNEVRLAVRMDKNLTTVGFFWDTTKIDGADDSIWEVVRRNLRSWSAGGPVILVSSCVPSPMAVENYYSPQPEAILHLLGRTPLPMLDRLRYHALNWEATTNPNPPRLCRAQILTLRPAADPPVWPRVQTCEFRETTPSNNRLPSDEVPKPPPPEATPTPRTFTNPPEFFADTRAKIWDLLFPKDRSKCAPRQLILVRGLPGAGKFTFFKEMKLAKGSHFSHGEATDNETKYLVQPVKLWSDDLLANWRSEIEDAERELARLTDAKTCGILLVYEKANPGRAKPPQPTEDAQRRTEILDQLRSMTKYKVIYLADDEVNLHSYVQEDTKAKQPSKGVRRPRELEEAWLPPLGRDRWKELLDRYDKVPVDEHDLHCLTGGLLGLGIRALEAIRASLSLDSGDSGNPPIPRKLRWTNFLGLAQSSKEIRELTQKLGEFLNITLPPLVRTHLYHLVTDHKTEPHSRNLAEARYALATTEKAFKGNEQLGKYNAMDSGKLDESWKKWMKQLEIWGLPFLTGPGGTGESTAVPVPDASTPGGDAGTPQQQGTGPLKSHPPIELEVTPLLPFILPPTSPIG
jgi:hypothetical protein